jgi:glucose/arabinose dehydrogenase
VLDPACRSVAPARYTSAVRLLAIIGLLTACGDNRAGPGEAGLPIDAPPAWCAPAGHGLPLPRRIVYGCKSPGAPPAPACIDDTVTLVTSPPGDDRLFALERAGRIRIIEHEQLRAQPFADLRVDVGGPVLTDNNELGLLGLAFHPQFAQNRTLFVYYTATNPDSVDTAHPYVDVLARYTASASDRYAIDPTSAAIVLSIPDPYSNHNGGMIEFGNDGLLYISTGDGGNGGDPMGNAQNPNALLGKMLRIDVDRPAGPKPYGIPSDNPYAAGGGAPEVFLRGLRNPWRWSFDRATGDMWIGDVGQALVEEIDVLPAGQQAGKNLGWNVWEANSCYSPPCDQAGFTFPLDTRTHPAWWAIIGGQVYRGTCYPEMQGWYFYTDCGFGFLVRAKLHSDGTLETGELPGTFVVYPASLHADWHGELYESSVIGDIFHLEPGPTP